MPKEQYMCQLCANHGTFNQPKKGHKQKCPHRNCPCGLCALNTKRRALDQIERQLKSTSGEGRTDSSTLAKELLRCTGSPQLSPATIKLPPTVSPPVTHKSSIPPFCVALPATISRRYIKSLRKDDSRSRPVKAIENALETLQRHRSIFHSAEQLAR